MTMFKISVLEQLKMCKRFFNNSISVLEEKDADFKPADGMMTVCEQTAHAAQSVEWFMRGMFSPQGFDFDFEKAEAEAQKVKTHTEALEWMNRALDEAMEKIEGCSESELLEPIPAGPMMKSEPRIGVIPALVDHTAHHRGSLVVYARLLGKTPNMPYGNM
ncbi:DinB family protein [bacterium]|nr:DinB family protein [bacterium]